MAASRDLGEFIRELRSNARISLRQLAAQAGVSNPYLSQIERGLRKPSAEVLQQIANALRVSTPVMYLRAGLLAEREGQGVLAAIAADPDLSDRHKKTLIEIYEAFRRENLRAREEAAAADIAPAEPVPVDTTSAGAAPAEAVPVDTPVASAPAESVPGDATPVASALAEPVSSDGGDRGRPAGPARGAKRRATKRDGSPPARRAARRTAGKPSGHDHKEES